MKYRELTSVGDYMLGGRFLTGKAAVAQAIGTRLKLLLGEWWEDRQDGLPLFQSILGRRGIEDDLRAVDMLIRDRILGTPETRSIASFTSGIRDRRYWAKVTVETLDGDTVEVMF